MALSKLQIVMLEALARGVMGGAPDDPPPDNKPAPTGGDDGKALAARVAAAEKAAADAQAKLDKFAKDQKDADDKDRLKRGEHEKLIAELKAQNESTAAALKEYEKSLDERATKLLEKLDDEDKERVERYKAKLSKADWLGMIEEAVEIGGSAGGPPPAPTPGGGRPGPTGGDRELQPQTMEILDMLGVSPDKAKKLKVTKLADGNHRFSDTIRGFLDKLKERASATPAFRERKPRA